METGVREAIAQAKEPWSMPLTCVDQWPVEKAFSHPGPFSKACLCLPCAHLTPRRFLKRRLHLFVTFGYFAYICNYKGTAIYIVFIFMQYSEIKFLFPICGFWLVSCLTLLWREVVLILRTRNLCKVLLCFPGGGGFRRSGTLVMEIWLDEAAHTSNPGIWEAEARGCELKSGLHK